jgi:hypothetical protein
MRGFCRSVFLVHCLLATGSILTPASAEPSTFLDDFQQLSGLLQAGETAQGLSLARELEADYAGIPEFDYLYGLAAIAERDYNTASFAFERILILQPDHHRARLELARSQYHLGNLVIARQGFQKVLAANPPHEVRERVNDFLAAIEHKETTRSHQFGLNLTFGTGHDTNIRSATDVDTVELFGLRFLIPEEGRELGDDFTRWGSDGQYRYQFSQTQAVSTGLGYERKDNLTEDDFDISEARWFAAYSHRLGDHQLKGKLKADQYWLGEQPLLRITGVETQWQYRAKNSRPYLFLFGAALRYPDNSFQDRNQYLAGLGFQRFWPEVVTDISVYGAHEPAREDGVAGVGRDHAGVNASVAWLFTSNQSLGLKTGYLHSRYHDRSALFNETRQDEKASAELFWQYRPNARLKLEMKATYRDNHSSLPIYSYDQFVAEAGVVVRIF